MIAYDLDNLDYNFVDKFSEPKIFLNKFMELDTAFIQQNSKKINISTRYKYRPDLLAYEYYEDDMYYPCILAANNIGSIFSFRPDRLDFECYIPDINFIKEYMK